MNVRLQHGDIFSHSHLSADPTKLRLHHGDLSDSTNLVYIIAQVQPTEVYNLGAQSHVKVSFEMSEYTVCHFINRPVGSALAYFQIPAGGC